MSSYQGINDLELQSIEYAKVLQSVIDARTNRVIKLAIPKIMSLGNTGVKDYIVKIDRSLVLNAQSSLPIIPSSVKAQNYISVPIADSAYRSSYNTDNKGRIRINAGAMVTCIITNGNIKDIKVTDY